MLKKTDGGTQPAVDNRFIHGTTAAFRSWLLTNMRPGFRRQVQDVCLRCSGSRHGWLFPWPNRSAPPGPWPPCLASPTLPGSSSLRSAPTRLAPPGVSRPWLVPPRDSVSRNIFQWGVTCLFSFLGRPHLRNVFRIALLIGCCGFG